MRDFARFGLLYLNRGTWNGRQVISEELAEMAVSQPLPPHLPRDSFVPAEMIMDQRSLGSEQVPDNQNEHSGSYSWCWWINGIDAVGRRYLPSAPPDTFCAAGDDNGRRGMAVIPSEDIVLVWNDTALDVYRLQPGPLDDCLKLLMEAVKNGRSPAHGGPLPVLNEKGQVMVASIERGWSFNDIDILRDPMA